MTDNAWQNNNFYNISDQSHSGICIKEDENKAEELSNVFQRDARRYSRVLTQEQEVQYR